jgi:hypothetical protein
MRGAAEYDFFSHFATVRGICRLRSVANSESLLISTPGPPFQLHSSSPGEVVDASILLVADTLSLAETLPVCDSFNTVGHERVELNSPFGVGFVC